MLSVLSHNEDGALTLRHALQSLSPHRVGTGTPGNSQLLVTKMGVHCNIVPH
ncbi:MAG: hypothetical protein AAGB11_16285 [Pseudomonadota bacterium]